MGIIPSAPPLSDTDSDADSLPFDQPDIMEDPDSAQPNLSSPEAVHSSDVQPAVTVPYATAPSESQQLMNMPSFAVAESDESMPNVASNWNDIANKLVSSVFSYMPADSEQLRIDPRDRIGDASVVEGDSDSDFEIISTEELE